MEEKINYSFIIPHKNCPDLLRRCVDSIPQRADIQIIVVDDNSDEGKKPNLDRKDVEVILLDAEHSKGAGRARNVGLSHAAGLWLLFPDADDFYEKGFLKILDNYVGKSGIDILYFSCKSVDNETLASHPIGNRIQVLIEQYDKSQNSLNLIKYKTNVPWCKMIRRQYVLEYGFFYDEVRKGNDIKFSYISSYFTNKIEVIKERLYIHTYNRNGITKSYRSVDGSIDFRLNGIKAENFLDYIGQKHLSKKMPFYKIYLSVLKNQGIKSFCCFIFKYIFNHKNIFSTQYDYISTLETIKVQVKIKNMHSVDDKRVCLNRLSLDKE